MKKIYTLAIILGLFLSVNSSFAEELVQIVKEDKTVEVETSVDKKDDTTPSPVLVEVKTEKVEISSNKGAGVLPGIAIKYPIHSAVSKTNDVLVSFEATNDPTRCWYDLGGLRLSDGVIGDPSDGAYQYPLENCLDKTINLPSGDYVLNLFAENEAGANFDSVWFKVDVQPSVVILNPIKDTNSTNIALNFEVTNANTCWYDLGGTEKFPLPGCLSKNINLPDGDYVLNLFAQNTSGNFNFDSTWFKVILPPTINLISPKEGDVKTSNMVDLEFTTENAVSCWYDLGGTEKFSLPGCKGVKLNLEYNKDYVLNLYAKNRVGDEDLQSIWFKTAKKKVSSGGSSGSIINPVTVTPAEEGRVLGETTSCGIYVDKFLRRGYQNDTEAVKKVQKFLNDYMKLGLKEDGIFGVNTENAVKAFQKKHADEILAPWNLSTPTGIFYLTTQTAVNNIMCPDLKLTKPTSLLPFNLNSISPKKA